MGINLIDIQMTNLGFMHFVTGIHYSLCIKEFGTITRHCLRVIHHSSHDE